jgi:Zn-dependent peptidase ImmA (M78 family)
VDIHVVMPHGHVMIDREVFEALFENSVVATRAGYERAKTAGRIRYEELVGLSRDADLPYSLFFAPKELVERQLRRKAEILVAGAGKQTLSLNSRGSVQLTDIELIVKDLQRKQELLKRHDKSLLRNQVVGCLRRTSGDALEDAVSLACRLDFDHPEYLASKSRTAALEYVIRIFEAKQLLVSQHAQHYMPQLIPKRAQFSGLCVKDKKIPYLFLNSRDGEESFEPIGRKIFTLVLLAVLIARGRSTRVTYSDQSSDVIKRYEYEVAEHILLPADHVRALRIRSLDDVKEHANHFHVTPSALLMRARRLRLVNDLTANRYLAALQQEFAARGKPHRRSPLPITALRKYNGVEYSRRLLEQMDAGHLPRGEVTKVLFRDRLDVSQLEEFRRRL